MNVHEFHYKVRVVTKVNKREYISVQKNAQTKVEL